jgi:hypothetical protein
MALSPNQRIISADDHMDLHVLPPEVFQGRLPRGLRGRGPKVVDNSAPVSPIRGSRTWIATVCMPT